MNQIQVRHADATDAERLTALVAGVSARSAFLRFFAGVGHPSPRLVSALLRRDATHGAWVAAAGDTLVGHATWGVEAADRGPSPEDRVEVGILVADAWQGRGLGRALFQRALHEASARGLSWVSLHVHTENTTLARRLADGAVSVTRADGVVTAVRPLHELLLRRPDHVLVA